MTHYGLFVAAISAISTSLQQYCVRSMQLSHGVSALELLSIIAPGQGAFLLVVGPFVDYGVSSSWIFEYIWTYKSIFMVLVSCGLAIIVNFSQFVCLGQFSIVSFQVSNLRTLNNFIVFTLIPSELSGLFLDMQVLGYAKTIIILLLSWFYLEDLKTFTKVSGVIIAIVGMYWYNRNEKK